MMYKAEPICRLSIAFAQHNFRSDVLRRATYTVRELFFGCADFGQSEICDFDVSFLIKEDVFWFEIPIDDVARV